MEHTKEPWICGDDEDSDYCLVGPHDGDGIVYQPVVKLHSEANARRIVACVNSFAGISTENIEDNLPVKELARRYNDVIKQRDKLLEELEMAAKYHASHECYAEAKRVESFIASIKGESA